MGDRGFTATNYLNARQKDTSTSDGEVFIRKFTILWLHFVFSPTIDITKGTKESTRSSPSQEGRNPSPRWGGADITHCAPIYCRYHMQSLGRGNISDLSHAWSPGVRRGVRSSYPGRGMRLSFYDVRAWFYMRSHYAVRSVSQKHSMLHCCY
jgi:hypothetical protein